MKALKHKRFWQECQSCEYTFPSKERYPNYVCFGCYKSFDFLLLGYGRTLTEAVTQKKEEDSAREVLQIMEKMK